MRNDKDMTPNNNETKTEDFHNVSNRTEEVNQPPSPGVAGKDENEEVPNDDETTTQGNDKASQEETEQHYTVEAVEERSEISSLSEPSVANQSTGSADLIISQYLERSASLSQYRRSNRASESQQQQRQYGYSSRFATASTSPRGGGSPARTQYSRRDPRELSKYLVASMMIIDPPCQDNDLKRSSFHVVQQQQDVTIDMHNAVPKVQQPDQEHLAQSSPVVPAVESPHYSTKQKSRVSYESLDSKEVESCKEEADEQEQVPQSPQLYRHDASDDSKFEQYALLVDPNQEDRAVQIELYSFARPHMRAFHLSWISFFVAFFTWFAITPLLSEVQNSLLLNRQQIWTSSTFAVAGSAVTRILIGPICDKYGARWSMSGTLILSAIPTALLGLVNSSIGLSMLRLGIGVAGSAFVTSQYWTSSFFTWEVAGTANALVAGWGNLGGGVTQVVMGSLLFPLFKICYGGSFGKASDLSSDDAVSSSTNSSTEERASELAWRTVCVVPAVICLITAYCVVRYSDDSPKGNYGKRRRLGSLRHVSARRALWRGMGTFNTWLLMIQYGCCFGVEITMVNAAALYFKEEFGQTTESAAAIASVFGWMNLFARGVGGFTSDMANAKTGMRGRLVVQTLFLVLEGVTVVLFAMTHTLGGAIALMVVFSVFVQGAEGSTFGIVPYVDPFVTGAISGVVGAGGNVGGVGFSLLFRQHADRWAFKTMGYIAMASAAVTPLICLPGHRSLLCGLDAPEIRSRRDSYMQQMGNLPSVHHHHHQQQNHHDAKSKSSSQTPE